MIADPPVDTNIVVLNGSGEEVVYQFNLRVKGRFRSPVAAAACVSVKARVDFLDSEEFPDRTANSLCDISVSGPCDEATALRGRRRSEPGFDQGR